MPNVSLGAGEVAEEHAEFLFRSRGPYRVTLDGEFLDYINVDYNTTYDQDMISYTNLTVTPRIVECGESADVTLYIRNLDNRSRTTLTFLVFSCSKASTITSVSGCLISHI